METNRLLEAIYSLNNRRNMVSLEYAILSHMHMHGSAVWISVTVLSKLKRIFLAANRTRNRNRKIDEALFLLNNPTLDYFSLTIAKLLIFQAHLAEEQLED